ncbi:MAG TPA: hypothetical protein VIK92_03210 [Thermaerobacter sp.]
MSERDLWELVLETRKDLDRWIERGRRAQAAAGRGDWEAVRAELEARRFLQEQVAARLERLRRDVAGPAAMGQGPGDDGAAAGQRGGGSRIPHLLGELEEHLRKALEADRRLRLALAVRHEALGERVRVFEQARRALAAYGRQVGERRPESRPG